MQNLRLFLVVFLASLVAGAGSSFEKCFLKLAGTAAGGELTFAEVPPHKLVVSVKTSKGETAQAVLEHLAAELNRNAAFREGNNAVTVKENRMGPLRGFQGAGGYVLGGTDSGFAIPPTPTSLSVAYDFKQDQLTVYWEGNETTYDTVAVVPNGHETAPMPSTTKTRYFVRVSRFPEIHPLNDHPFCVVAYRNGVPSNAGIIRLRGTRQEEYNILPFTKGVAPNWRSWIAPGTTASVEFREEALPEADGLAWRCQGLLATGKDKTAEYRFGVWRKFLGLTPGARYRLGVKLRCTTGDAKRTARVLVKIAALQEGAPDFSPDTLSGLAVGKGARQLFECRPSDSAWRTNVTGKGKCPDIELPPDCRALLVWVQMEGTGDGTASAAFDGLFLECLPVEKK